MRYDIIKQQKSDKKKLFLSLLLNNVMFSRIFPFKKEVDYIRSSSLSGYCLCDEGTFAPIQTQTFHESKSKYKKYFIR